MNDHNLRFYHVFYENCNHENVEQKNNLISADNKLKLEIKKDGLNVEVKLSEKGAMKVITSLAKELGVKSVISALMDELEK